MSEITFFVPGEPVAKARARVLRSGSAFTPDKTASYENLVKIQATEAMRRHTVIEGPVMMMCVFYFQRPKSLKKKAPRLKATKPDIENMCKSIMDACNGIVYRDDAQVAVLNTCKYYANGEEPIGASIKIMLI